MKNPSLCCDQDSGKIHPALKEYFGYILKKSAFRFKHEQEKALKSYDIFPQHIGILKILMMTPSINQITLGDEMGVDKATMVKFLDHLEKKKLVRRVVDPNDRRGKLIKITAPGQERLNEAGNALKDVTEAFLKPLSKSDRKVLHGMLLKLISSS